MTLSSSSVCEAVLNLFNNSVNGWSSFCLIISVNSIIRKTNQGWHKLWKWVLNSSNTGFLWIGGSWYKSPTTIILSPANSWLFGVAKISFSCWWICSKVVLDTIEISWVIISFKSDNAILICVLFWSDMGGRLSPDSFGIVKAVLLYRH